MRNPKAYSIGALAYEYGAEMQILKPRLHMWRIDSLQVWYLAPSISSMVLSLHEAPSFDSLAASYVMNKQNVFLSVLTCAREQ